MLKTAVCDDNITDLSNITSILNDYNAMHMNKRTIDYTAFQNAADLIASLERGQRYDLILIDVLMPFITGMQAAKEIRRFNKDVKIIFISNSAEFAVESYNVDAFYYALKPIWKDQLFLLLNKVMAELDSQIGTSILIKSKAGLTRVNIHHLEFAEVNGRSIYYHITDGTVIEAAGTMSELEQLLSGNSCFIKPHRSYIINMEHLDTLSQRDIVMRSRKIVPIAKANYGSLRSAYIEFTFHDLKMPGCV